MKKRFNGTGCIRRLSGNRRKPYQVILTIAYDSRTKTQTTRTLGTFETYLDAELYLCNYLTNSTAAKCISLDAIFNEYMEIKKNKLTEYTISNYNVAFKKLSNISNNDINSITLKQLQSIINQLSDAYQQRVKSLLVSLYDFSIKNEYTEKNIAKYIEINKYRTKDKNVFSIDEINKISASNKSIDVIVQVLLYTGMRISELIDLEIKDVDLVNHMMQVKRSKTKAGLRYIPIHSNIYDTIKCNCNNNTRYVFEKNSRKLVYKNIYKQFKHRYPEHTIHEARHTFITNCKKCNMDAYITKIIAGHSIKDITLDIYTHITQKEISKEFSKFKY